MKPQTISLVGQEPGLANSTAALDRAEALKAQASALAHDQVAGVHDLLDALAYLAGAVARSGEGLSPGVREVCRQIADEAGYRSKSLTAILERTS